MELNEKDITNYKDSLEQAVLVHIAAKSDGWTLTKGHEYVERMVSTIFGTPEHGGLVQYLQQEQAHLNLSISDAIARAETMIKDGWSVKKINERWFLLDSNFKKVIDVSGSPDVEPAPVISELSPENCWMMLDEGNARSLAKAATLKGVDTSLLVSPSFAYQFVMSNFGTEHPLFPFVQMYKGLGDILSKIYYFPSKEIISFDELRGKGFRVLPKLNPSDIAKTFISTGSKSYTVLPVSDLYFEDKPADATFVPEAQWKSEILKSCGVEVEVPIQIGEFDYTFALGFEDKGHYTSVQDLGEAARILYTVQQQGKAKNYPLFEKLAGQIAAVFFMEVFIVGNKNFTLADVNIDTVSPKVTLRYTAQGHMYTDKELKYALENLREGELSFADFITLSPDIREPEMLDNLKKVVDILPDSFKSAVKKAESKDGYISRNLKAVSEYL